MATVSGFHVEVPVRRTDTTTDVIGNVRAPWI
jgi:hypothetical protein